MALAVGLASQPPVAAAPLALTNTQQCRSTLPNGDEAVGINYTANSDVTYTSVTVSANGADVLAFVPSPFNLVWSAGQTIQYRFQLTNFTVPKDDAEIVVTYFDATGSTVQIAAIDLTTFPCIFDTVMTLTSSNNPADIMENVIFTATVNPIAERVLPGVPAPTGTVSFYHDGTPFAAGVVPLSGDTAQLNTVWPDAGSFVVRAEYSGDTWFRDNSRQLTQVISQAVTDLTTTASSTVPVAGGTIFDTATLAGGVNPTGTITFNLFGPDDPTCTGGPSHTSVVAVNGNGDYPSATYFPTTAGTYYWTAVYSGDSNNTASASPCNAPNESVVVTKRVPALSGQATPTATLTATSPATISADATLSDAYVPGGSLTFLLFGPGDATCSGPAVFSSVVPVSGNGTYNSGDFGATSPGEYRWIVVYSGDANNEAVALPCGSPNMISLVTTVCSTSPKAANFPGHNFIRVTEPGVITTGTEGDDLIIATHGFDRINGAGGNDIIFGLGDVDHITGGAGSDTLCGGGSADWLAGAEDADLLDGGGGNDDMAGGDGDDDLYGGLGVNRLAGGNGTDRCDAGPHANSQKAGCEL